MQHECEKSKHKVVFCVIYGFVKIQLKLAIRMENSLELLKSAMNQNIYVNLQIYLLFIEIDFCA